MLRQTDKLLPEAIQRWGCYFMSVLYHAELRRKKTFYADEIISIYRACLTTGVIGKEVYKDDVLVDGCFVNDPVSLFQIAGVRVGSVIKMDAKYKAAPRELELLCYHRPANTPSGINNAEHTHFIPGRDGKPIWDPIENSNTVKYGYLKSKRIFK